MGDLLLVLPRPLARDDDRHPALFVEIGQASFRLQVGVLLGRRSVLPFDDHIRLGPSRVHIPLPNLVMADNVPLGAQLGVDLTRLSVRVELRGVGLERLEGIGDHGKILVVHPHKTTRPRRHTLGLGHDQRHLIAYKAHHVAPRL